MWSLHPKNTHQSSSKKIPTTIDQASRVSVSSRFRNAYNMLDNSFAIASAKMIDRRTAMNSKFDVVVYV